MLPEAVRPLFWDVDTDRFDAIQYPQYTIERVLEYGDQVAVGWLWALFGGDRIASVLTRSRRLSRRSANFWALVLEVPRDQVRSLQPRRP
jgi:hypothetical protein